MLLKFYNGKHLVLLRKLPSDWLRAFFNRSAFETEPPVASGAPSTGGSGAVGVVAAVFATATTPLERVERSFILANDRPLPLGSSVRGLALSGGSVVIGGTEEF